MATALALAFGLMLLLTLGTIITASIYTAGENTRQLLTVRLNLTLDAIENGVRAYLQPIETQLAVLRQKMISAEIQPELDDAYSQDFISGLLTAAAQIKGIGILEEDGRFHYQERFKRSITILNTITAEEMDELFHGPSQPDEVVWGTPVWSSLVDTTVINARIKLDLHEGRQRYLFAAVELAAFAQWLNTLAVQLGQPVFVLHGEDRLIGHNGFDPNSVTLSQNTPLPHVSQASDPILAAIVRSERDRMNNIAPDVRGMGRSVTIDDIEHKLISREVDGFTDLAWTIGTHIPTEEVAEQVRRFVGLLFLSLIVSIAAIIVTIVIGRRMSKPVERLSDHAQHISKLEFSDISTLEGSSIRELNTASAAFNDMTKALRWFEAYVPKRLVRQLVQSHGNEGIPSSEVDVTVMFTDIVGFTNRTMDLAPSEVASFINGHFAVLKECIEKEEGTIDKYIGDSVMAFWGAPEPAHDHALRACRAALAIRAALEHDAEAPAIRIGLQSGPTLVGNIGAAGRLNYTIVGETVNLAQRIEQLGKTVSIGEKTTIVAARKTIEQVYALGNTEIEAEPVQNLPVSGTNSTIDVYRL